MNKNLESDKKVYDYLFKNIKSAWKSHFWLLVPLIRKIKPQNIVELGTDRGFSLLTFLTATNGEYGKIYGIDSYGSVIKNDPGFKNGLKRYNKLLDFKKNLLKNLILKMIQQK